MLKYAKINAAQKHTASFIFLHGLGDTGHGWSTIAGQLAEKLPHVRFIFPHAPERPITLNFGMEMPGWYDIVSLADFDKQDEPGLMESRTKISELIEAEISLGIESDRIAIGGFSQGAAMSYLTGLTYPKKLAGIAILSGYLPIHKKIFSLENIDVNRKIRIFSAHGTADPVVRYELGENSVKELQKNGYSVQFCSYPGMEHSSSEQELRDLAGFLSTVLPKN
ncbi:Acyl-protein thioesterase 1 [Smittium culicis]|uniref:Acyl-protein thioesterase 1 n=1 Tax=Smittium culicis TaxID=133412 RepID=A0A1R1XYJ4_9FUNG|nr:Acyl-protein thioesterase 1 [Smittium culicis]